MAVHLITKTYLGVLKEGIKLRFGHLHQDGDLLYDSISSGGHVQVASI